MWHWEWNSQQHETWRITVSGNCSYFKLFPDLSLCSINTINLQRLWSFIFIVQHIKWSLAAAKILVTKVLQVCWSSITGDLTFSMKTSVMDSLLEPALFFTVVWNIFNETVFYQKIQFCQNLNISLKFVHWLILRKTYIHIFQLAHVDNIQYYYQFLTLIY